MRFRTAASLLLEVGVVVLVETVDFFGSQHIPPNIRRMKDIAFSFSFSLKSQVSGFSAFELKVWSFGQVRFSVLDSIFSIMRIASLPIIIAHFSTVFGLDVVNCTYAPNVGTPIHISVENECA